MKNTVSFSSFLASQALGAFNDNAFKTFVALLALATLPADQSAKLIAIAGGLFIVPFLLFSTFAGTMADRWSKKRLIIIFKAIEVVLMLLSGIALYVNSIHFLMALLFLMGVHSAFFGPVKYAILPELLPDRELSNGNGLVQMTTFLGIILGTMAAGLLLRYFRDQSYIGGIVFTAVAVAGLIAGFFIQDVPAAGNRELFNPNFPAQIWRNLKELHGYYTIYLATIGSAYFWFIGAIFQMNLLLYSKNLMGLNESAATNLQIIIAIGIGLGSYLAGRMSRDRVELGLVPVGALGLVLFSLDLAFSFRSTTRTMLDLLLLGVSAGCFSVPLQAFIQQRAPKAECGKMISTGNILSFAAILIASAWLWAFGAVFKLQAGQVFLVIGVMTLVVALYIIWMLPDFFLRLLLYPLANLVYRINVLGQENVPLDGPALLVSNHISFIDAFLVAMANQRMVRFLMFRTYYDIPVLHWLFRAMRCIPISDHDGPKALIESFRAARKALEDGELVCIFAEGEISRHGQMLRFKKGFERIVDGLNVPVIPVHLDQVWGSIFSFERGRVLLKRPRRIPYPLTVSVGKPMSSGADAFSIREAVQELGSEAFSLRLARKQPIPLAFVCEAKRHPFRLAMADSSSRKLSYGGALAEAALLGRALGKIVGPDERVGILLPPSASAALANIGLSLIGKVCVNLNYTTSREIVMQCAAKAQIGRIVTSRKFIEKLGWPADERFLYLEDAAHGISRLSKAMLFLTVWLLPATFVEKLFPKARCPLDHLATIMFTSGSTGNPKGVMLTHANILANIEALAQVYQMSPSDRILGVLPFFHSFGYTGTLWLPFIAGFSAVYHHNPLDAKRIGELVKDFQITFLIGTPTFLQAYLRRVEPDRFKNLRMVVVGAEKLRQDLAQAFEKKFGIVPLEGYGCTELSPAAAVNIPDIDWPDARQKGKKLGSIGHPLPGVVMKVVHPETKEAVAQGEPGLLLVKGPNVMKGYLDETAKTAEAIYHGYYVTGDIGAVDLDGFVTITDRLSRFSKIGGEMVPHIKVEEKLHEIAARIDQTFVVAAVADDKRGERLVVLYKELDDVDGLLKKLQESDLPKLWIPDRGVFFKVDDFPLLGSGKLDLQRLKVLANELTAASKL